MSEAKETVFDTHTYHFFYIAIGKMSNFTWISTRQRVGKKSDNCIGDSFPSILFRESANYIIDHTIYILLTDLPWMKQFRPTEIIGI